MNIAKTLAACRAELARQKKMEDVPVDSTEMFDGMVAELFDGTAQLNDAAALLGVEVVS